MVDPDDDLESTVERLRDRVDDLESQLDQESRSPATATRRDALKAGGAGALLGALGLGSITSGASADPQGRLGSASDPVQQAYINEADVTALNAEGATIGATTLDPKDSPYTIADDSAITVDMTDESVFIITANRTGASGVFVSDFDRLNDGILEANTTNQGGGTALSGTTGPDGSLNVSKQDWDLYIENRVGSSAEVDIITFTR